MDMNVNIIAQGGWDLWYNMIWLLHHYQESSFLQDGAGRRGGVVGTVTDRSG